MVVFPELKQFFEGTYKSVEGRIDNYEVFIEKGVSLCGKNGILGFIVPSPLLSNLYSRKLRRWILRNCDIKEITNFGIKVFADPTIHTCIIILKRGTSKDNSIKIRAQVAYREQLKEAYDY